MKHNICRWIMCLCLLGLVSMAEETTIFNDTFDVGASPTVGDDGDDPNDTAWTPFSTGPSISVQDDGGNNVLSYTSTSTYRGITADISPITLSDGDFVSLSFKIRTVFEPVTAAGGFRFALQNSGGTDDDGGYMFAANFGDSTAAAIYECAHPYGFGGAGTVFSSTDYDITGTDWHTFNVTIARVDDTHLSFTYGMDGTNYADAVSYEDTSPTFTFDTIAIGEGGTTQAFLLDDIQLNADQTIIVYQETVKFNDTFDVGAAPTVDDDGDDPNDTAWAPFSTGPSISVQDDGGNNVLSYTSTSSYRGLTTDIDPVTLNTGESISLNFKMRTSSEPATAEGGFRIALLNSGGAAGAYGYMFVANFGDGTSAGVYESTAASGFGGTGRFLSSTDFDITGTDWHTFNLTITRVNDTHLTFTYGMDGTNYIDSTAQDTAPTFTFDTIGIGEGGSTEAFLVDDVQLSANQELFIYSETVEFNDTFDVGSVPTVDDDGDDPDDTAWAPFSTGPSLSVQDDGGNNVLSYTSTSSYRGMTAEVSPVTISDGESVNLSFKMRAASEPATVAAGFRFSLQNSSGTDDDGGYVFAANFGDSTVSGIFECNHPYGFGTVGGFFSSADYDIIGTDWYTFNVTITRLGDTQLSFTYGINGTNYADAVSYTDTYPTFTFDTIAIGEGGATQAFLIDDIRFSVLRRQSYVPGYIGWAATYGVGASTNDDDGDGMINLYEYGLGGDPTNALDQGTAPQYGVMEIGGTSYFGYSYPQLTNANDLIYSLEVCTNLVDGIWTNAGYTVYGTNVTGEALNIVSNYTDIAAGQKFIRLVIEEK